MSVTIPGTNNGHKEWLSVTEAALLSKVSERTVQRWIEAGRVVSDMSDDGRRRVRRDSLAMSDVSVTDSSPVTDRPAGADRQVSDVSVRVSDGLSDSVSDNPAGPTLSDVRHESRVVECACCRVREEQARTLTDDVSFLRAQVDRHAEAEQQLRVMLAKMEHTNAELAGALVMKALPPAPETDTQPVIPKRVRWWSLWRKR